MHEANGAGSPPRRERLLADLIQGVVVGNEFASVEICVDTSGRVPRALLRDVMSGQARYIDPLVLEALVHMDDKEMQRLADPNLIVSNE
jgi:hypothetical protein